MRSVCEDEGGGVVACSLWLWQVFSLLSSLLASSEIQTAAAAVLLTHSLLVDSLAVAARWDAGRNSLNAHADSFLSAVGAVLLRCC